MAKNFSSNPGLYAQTKLAQVQVPLAKIISIQKLIQLSQSDFITHIEKTVSENPFLEKPEVTALPPQSITADGYFTSSRNLPGSFNNHGEQGNPLEEMNADTAQSLTGNLLEQIKWLTLSVAEEKIAVALISLIDQDGFLSEVALNSVNEVVEELNVKRDTPNLVNVSETDKAECVMKVLRYLQAQLDPAGILARSFPDALSLMLQRKGFEKNALPIRIVEDGFDALSKKDYSTLKKQFKVSLARVKEAVKTINALDPHPLRSQSAEPITANAIIPDVVVRERSGVLEVEINREYIPQVRLLKDVMNETLKSKVREPSALSLTEAESTESGKKFLFEKKNEALNLISAITFRESNLKKIMDYLVKEQYEFLKEGFVKLKPMRIIDLAEKLSIDKASISRLVNQKYVATYWGTFPLREMFSLPVAAGRDNPVSAKEIQAKIRQLTEEFNDKKLSDQKIANMLSELGYKIARRTVNKYRKLITD